MIFNCDIARSLASPLSVSDRIQDRPLAPDDGQQNFVRQSLPAALHSGLRPDQRESQSVDRSLAPNAMTTLA